MALLPTNGRRASEYCVGQRKLDILYSHQHYTEHRFHLRKVRTMYNTHHSVKAVHSTRSVYPYSYTGWVPTHILQLPSDGRISEHYENPSPAACHWGLTHGHNRLSFLLREGEPCCIMFGNMFKRHPRRINKQSTLRKDSAMSREVFIRATLNYTYKESPSEVAVSQG